jgi:hypothetical protein
MTSETPSASTVYSSAERQIEIRVHDDVRHVAVNEELARE